MILSQDSNQASLVELECRFSNSKIYRFKKERHQVGLDTCFYQTSASSIWEHVPGEREVRVIISVTFMSVFTAEAFFVWQKHLVDSLGRAFIFRMLFLLEQKLRIEMSDTWMGEQFKLCIQVHRDDRGVGRSFLTYGWGFDEHIKIKKRTEPFLASQFRPMLLDGLGLASNDNGHAIESESLLGNGAKEVRVDVLTSV